MHISEETHSLRSLLGKDTVKSLWDHQHLYQDHDSLERRLQIISFLNPVFDRGDTIFYSFWVLKVLYRSFILAFFG